MILVDQSAESGNTNLRVPLRYMIDMVLVWVVLVRMCVPALTERVDGFSTARFAVVPAASLSEHHPAPEVAREFGQFLVQRHWLR